MPKKDLIAGPVGYPLGKPPAGHKATAPGSFDGEPGYFPKRTKTPNAPPERTRDTAPPLPPKRKG